MNLEQGQGIQIIDLFGFARRRGKLVALVSGSVILATFWVAMALPNLYTSSAAILVEPQSVDEALVDSGVRDGDLNERLGLMTAEILSRSRLSLVIDKFDLYADEQDEMERFEIVELMRSFINVEPVLSEIEGRQQRNRDLKFNTFRIVFRHEHPLIARDVAQEFANDFINANIDARTEITRKSLDFMQDEIASLTAQLAAVEKSIAEVKAESAGRLPEEFDSNQRRVQYALGDLRDAQRIFDAAENDAAYWKNQALTSAGLSSPNDKMSPGNRIRVLEIERGSLLARGFTARHPDVVRVETEMAILRRMVAVRGEDEDAPMSIGEQNARAEEGRAVLRAEAAAADIERLRESVADLEARLAGTAAVAERLDALNRRYDHLYTSYQDFSSRLQQAGVQADLERRQLGEKFRILESAEQASEPSSPNRFLLLTLGAILGLALGGGIGLIAELTDSSMHTSNDLQQALGIPVLVSVPRIMLESDRVARSRRIMRESVAAVAVVLLVLIGGLVTYRVVNATPSLEIEEVEEPASASTRIGSRIGIGTG
ncbi:MAG: hypothetical protein CL908_03800 [Deltaproteobacteria bacterium]|nr:hypothetical protein [Deltaproteobacteria bacterium]